MDVKAEILMQNMAADVESTTVESVLRRAACEWLDLDQHPQDLTVSAWTDPIVEIAESAPLYVISDLHFGDGGFRDNFAYGSHARELSSFLDMVEANRGRLVICGDLFELWQSNISKVLTRSVGLLNRLARMRAIYVLGNHDADLSYFTPGWLGHPFFRTMRLEHTEKIGGRYFHFIHGHQADPYCASDTPGLGRITAIYSGLAEDRNGGPMLNKYRTVEDKVVGRLERLVSLWNRLRGKPDRFTEINRGLGRIHDRDHDCDQAVIVCGHTHFPGHIGTWHYNSGTWAECVNSFLRIGPEGGVGVFDWTDYRAVPNNRELPI